MPFFGRQGILAKTAAAAAGGTIANYWHSSSATQSSVFAVPAFGNNTVQWSDTNEFTLMIWYRAYQTPTAYTSGDIKGDNWYPVRFGWSDSPNLSGFAINSGAGPYNSGNSSRTLQGSHLSKNSNFGSATYVAASNAELGIDGSWHQLMIVIDCDDSSHRIWFDGVEKTYTSKSSSTTFNFATIKWFAFGAYLSNASPSSGNPTLSPINSHTVDIGPCAIWFSDINPQDDVSKWYDSANTDGYVHLGTDGTASGLTQPSVYGYVDSNGVVQNGGSLTSVTVVELSAGAATVTKVTDGTGPGSGDTRSTAY